MHCYCFLDGICRFQDFTVQIIILRHVFLLFFGRYLWFRRFYHPNYHLTSRVSTVLWTEQLISSELPSKLAMQYDFCYSPSTSLYKLAFFYPNLFKLTNFVRYGMIYQAL